jgi:hypothetical protein
MAENTEPFCRDVAGYLQTLTGFLAAFDHDYDPIRRMAQAAEPVAL